MHHNRISRYGSQDNVWMSLPASQPVTITVSASPTAGSMVMVPALSQQANWQAQLFRLAYERAVAALAPPRDHRYFSVWN